MKTAPDGLQTFELQFAETGLEGGRWKGAVVAFAGAESERFDHLISHMHRQIDKFIRILKSELEPEDLQMELELLKDIVVIFVLSVAVLFLFHRLRAPTIVGFLLTGILAGPAGLRPDKSIGAGGCYGRDWRGPSPLHSWNRGLS